MTDPAIHPTRRIAIGMLGTAVLWPRDALASGNDVVSGAAFGTTWRAAARRGQGLADLKPAIEALFAGIDETMSPWRPDSTISQFNRAPAGQHMRDRWLTSVTGAALDIARLSDGAFDPTVGPLVARWGFGPIQSGGLPDWRGLSIGAGGLSKARDDLTLDLCGIAKGWALDRAMALLQSAGLTDVLFELGGEFASLGQHPDGRDWRIGVEAPSPELPAQTALRLPPGVSIATSGTRTQSYVRDDRTYGHIIDPRTQEPSSGATRSVTVISESAMLADGWATALFAAGEDAGPALAIELGISAVFQVLDDGGIRKSATGIAKDLIL